MTRVQKLVFESGACKSACACVCSLFKALGMVLSCIARRWDGLWIICLVDLLSCYDLWVRDAACIAYEVYPEYNKKLI